MKLIILTLILSFFLPFQISAQEENFPVSEMKLAAKAGDGNFFDYFLIAVKDADTFQIVHPTGRHKTIDQHQFEPAMFLVIDYKRRKLIEKKLFQNYSSYLKRKIKAYFIGKIGLVYF